MFYFFFQAEDGIRDIGVTGVQTCALPISRYIGEELNSYKKDKNKVDVRFAFCFPDVYEVGMSHLGMKILYYVMNQREDIYCERAFAPWPDMEKRSEEHTSELQSRQYLVCRLLL